MNIFIRELWIYPVKSLGGVRVEQAACTTAEGAALRTGMVAAIA